MARARAALFLLAAAAMAFEVALTRLASVLLQATLTAVVIAGCLAALGLGAALAGRFAADPRLPLVAAAVASLGGGAAVACVVASPLGFALGLFAVPFLGVGAFAAWTYARSPGPPLTYAAEALGGAAGAVLAPFAIRALGDVDAALAAAALAGFAGLLACDGARRAWLLLAPLAFAFNLATHKVAVDPWCAFGYRPHLVRETKDKDPRLLATAWDFARTDLVATNEPWIRYLFTDRMYTARIPRWDGRSPNFADPQLEALARLKGFAFRALRPERVLVLGAGGGFDVALAVQAGARAVDAVEINGAMLRMTRAQGDFAGRVYERPEVQAHEAEARRFVRGASERYDLVSLSLLETDPAAFRTNTGFQNWVFTREAVSAYLDRLTDDGVLAIVQNTEEMAEKTLATAVVALETRGLAAPQAFEQIYVARLADPQRNPFAYLVLVAARPLGTTTARLDAALGPDMTVDARPGGPFAPRLAALADGSRLLADWVAASPARIDPPSDDRPFFFDLNRALPGLFVSLGLAGLALWSTLFLRDRLSPRPRLAPPGWLAAGGLGAGFLLLEAGLIARGQFLIGMPTTALVAVLGPILVAASLGAVLGPRLFPQPSRRLVFGASLTAVVAVGEALTWPMLAAHAPSSTGALVALTGGLAVAVGIPAGLCLPSLFEIHGAMAAASIYAANATATVAASATATLVAQGLGLRALFGLAGLCYAGSAVLAARRAYNAGVDVEPGLRRHVPADALEGAHLARILRFVGAHPQPFDRTIPEGHLTGSAVVISRSGDRVLLLHHKKLGIWLQPGGHGDPGETTGEAVALREAFEETGIRDLELHPTAPRPFDVDVHPIPARPGEPAHAHLDLRYLVIAPDSAVAVHDPAESHAIRWFTWSEIEAMELDAGLRRALGKVRAL